MSDSIGLKISERGLPVKEGAWESFWGDGNILCIDSSGGAQTTVYL